jgi:hypothetical protein
MYVDTTLKYEFLPTVMKTAASVRQTLAYCTISGNTAPRSRGYLATIDWLGTVGEFIEPDRSLRDT